MKVSRKEKRSTKKDEEKNSRNSAPVKMNETSLSVSNHFSVHIKFQFQRRHLPNQIERFFVHGIGILLVALLLGDIPAEGKEQDSLEVFDGLLFPIPFAVCLVL